MTYRIKGWTKFQHFKDRRPPWVKLYRDLLEDPDWHELDGESAKALVALWLIASEDEDQSGTLPDSRRLAFRLRMTETKVNQTLAKLSHWLEHDDINTISNGYQHDAPETETETETYKEEKEKKLQKTFSCPVDVHPDTWADFLQLRKVKKAPVTEAAIRGIEREAKKAGWGLDKALTECCARGWTGFKAEWVKTDEQKKMTPHAASMKAAGIAIFGNLEEQYEQRAAIDITPTQPATRFLGAEDIRDDAGSLRDTVDEHVEDRSDFI